MEQKRERSYPMGMAEETRAMTSLWGGDDVRFPDIAPPSAT